MEEEKPGRRIGSVGVAAGKGVTILTRIVRKGFTEKGGINENIKKMREQSQNYLEVECSRPKDQQVQRSWGRSVPGVFKDFPDIIPPGINRTGRGKESDRLITHCAPELSQALGQFWR